MTTLITAPYHLGHRGEAVGSGPLEVRASGIANELEAREVVIDLGPAVSWEEVNSAIAAAVTEARACTTFPLIVAGNCNSCLGTLAGIRDLQPGIVWFDAHGDFHTPETSLSGSLEGQSLTLATERFVPESKVVLVGARDLDPGERERVHDRLVYIPSGDLKSSRLPDLGAVYVHLDIDVLDPALSPGVNFQGLGGLTLDELLEALDYTIKRFDVAALAITNYNPAKDKDHRTRDIICTVLRNVCRLRRRAASR